jgi:multisubunit Na+/H+ antiporter MnhG subunit
MAFSNDATGTGRSLNQTLALTFGAVYALVGVIGFFVSSADGFAGDDGGKLLGIFGVNGLHNIVHLLIGVALVLASRTHAAARSTNLTIGAVYVLLAVLGPFINNTALDIVALNGPDHVLHALSGVLLVGVAVAMDKTRRTAAV